VLAKRVLPAQSGETIEVGVCRGHRAAVLDRYCGVVRVGHQICRSPGSGAEILEDLEVARPGMDDPRVGPCNQLATVM